MQLISVSLRKWSYFLSLLYVIVVEDAMEYVGCESVVKYCPPFKEGMKKRGNDYMDLVMVDPW